MTLKNFLLLSLSFIISGFFILCFFNTSPVGKDLVGSLELGSAIKNKVIFGKDFILDYGPLGALATRLPINTSPYLLLFFDLFVFANLTFILFVLLTRKDWGIVVRILFSVLVVMHGNVPIMLLWISVFLLFEYIESKNHLLLAIVILILPITFLIKFSTGSLAFFLFPAFLIHITLSGILSYKQSSLVYAVYLLLIFLLCYLFNVDFFAYWSNGLSFISGYQNSMYQPRVENFQRVDLIIGIACFILLILPFFIFFKKIISHKQTLFLYCIVVLLAFILFKVTFIRINSTQYFDFIILLAGLLVFFSKIEVEKMFYYSLLPIVLLVLVVTFKRENISDRTLLLLRSATFVPEYLHAGSYSAVNVPLPEGDIVYVSKSDEIVDAIAEGSVDVIPGTASQFKDGLNYTPRPVPISYLANTTKLDKLNAQFLAQEGPDFILFNSSSIDNRYTLFDEPQTKIELLKTYRSKLISGNGEDVLLERLEKPIQFQSELLMDDKFDFNEVISLPVTDEIQLAYAYVDYSIVGKIFSLLFWAPELEITFTLTNNTVKTFKCNRSLCEAGIVINKYAHPGSSTDYALLIDYFGMLNMNVKTVQFSSKSSWAFNQHIAVTVDKLKFERTKSTLDESHKPIVVQSSDLKVPDNVRMNIENLTIDKNRIDGFGWAFVNDSLLRDRRLTPALLLESKDHYAMFPIKSRIHRPDVKDVFGKNATDSAGFNFIFYRTFLDTSLYRVGIVFLDKDKIIGKAIFQGSIVDNRGKYRAGVPFEKFEFKENDHEGDLVQSVESINSNEKLLVLSGWAFLQNKKTSSFDSIKLILEAKDGTIYVGKANRVIRKDVSSYFKNPLLDSTGFQGNFDVTSMTIGVYRMGFYITNATTKETGYKFVNKISIGFPERFNVEPLEEGAKEGDVKFDINKVEDSFSAAKISGWAFVENTKASEYEISILLRSEDGTIFKSPSRSVFRPDVSGYFKKNNDLDDSGFETTIGKRKLARGEYQIGIYLKKIGENNGVYSFSDSYIER